jgi:hypothetical protein
VDLFIPSRYFSPGIQRTLVPLRHPQRFSDAPPIEIIYRHRNIADVRPSIANLPYEDYIDYEGYRDIAVIFLNLVLGICDLLSM